MAVISFRKALNKVTPSVGMTVAAYFSIAKLGSGTKPFLIIAITGRYVTLFYIPTLSVLRVKCCHWPRIPLNAVAVEPIQLFEELTQSMAAHTLKGKRWNARSVGRAARVIEEMMP